MTTSCNCVVYYIRTWISIMKSSKYTTGWCIVLDSLVFIYCVKQMSHSKILFSNNLTLVPMGNGQMSICFIFVHLGHASNDFYLIANNCKCKTYTKMSYQVCCLSNTMLLPNQFKFMDLKTFNFTEIFITIQIDSVAGNTFENVTVTCGFYCPCCSMFNLLILLF